MLPSTVRRVPAHTEAAVNERIRWQTQENIARYQNAGPAAIGRRLKELDAEWDIERTLIIQGDDDQVVPFGASAMLSSKLVKGSMLKVYAGAPHGLTATHKDRVNADLLSFVEGLSD